MKDRKLRVGHLVFAGNAGVAALVASLLYGLAGGSMSAYDLAAFLLLMTAAGMLMVELFCRVDHGPLAGEIDWQPRRSFSPDRLLVKLSGLAGTLGMIGLAYSVFPEYDKELYVPFFRLCGQYAWILLLAPVYFVFVDLRMEEAEDGYWHMGALLVGRRHLVDYGKLRQYGLAWCIKGFFLPLMFSFLVQHVEAAAGLQAGFSYRFLVHLLFGIDVVIATAGYLFTLRLFGWHVRSAEPTLSGWIVVLICYPPFNHAVFDSYFHYRGQMDFVPWMENYPLLAATADSVGLGLLLVYVLATVALGLRFSNLTHRGVVASGPYRYAAHPAYVSKVLFWGMEFLKAAPVDPLRLVQGILMLLGVATVYYLRARTEERHLSADPAYRAYVRYLRRYGLGARIRKAMSARLARRDSLALPSHP